MHGWALDACRTVVGSGVWTCGLVGVVLGVVWSCFGNIVNEFKLEFLMEMRQLKLLFIFYPIT